jgi:hypothetical protein
VSDTTQSVNHDVWTQSAADSLVWMFHNAGEVLSVVHHDDGTVTLSRPERWRFARAFRTADSHGWLAAPDLVPPFPPPLPGPDVTP